MEITPFVVDMFIMAFYGAFSFLMFSIVLNMTEKLRDQWHPQALDVLSKGKRLTSFQRWFCRIHPTENRPL